MYIRETIDNIDADRTGVALRQLLCDLSYVAPLATDAHSNTTLGLAPDGRPIRSLQKHTWMLSAPSNDPTSGNRRTEAVR